MTRAAVDTRQDRDIYRLSPSMDASTVQTMAERLEFRSKDEGYRTLSQAYFSRLPIESAERILALGCGTGVEVRALKQLGTSAEIVGIDHSPQFIEIARQLTENEGMGDGVTYLTADGHRLPDDDSSYDIVLLHTVLSHVDDPLSMLREVRRVLKPGGVVAIFDGDYDSLTFGYPDTDIEKQIEEMLMHLLIANPRVMRAMPQLLSEVGLEIIEAYGDLYADIGEGSFWANVPEAYSAILSSAGMLPVEVVEEWQAHQAEAVQNHSFFGASNFYTYLVRKPDGKEGNNV